MLSGSCLNVQAVGSIPAHKAVAKAEPQSDCMVLYVHALQRDCVTGGVEESSNLFFVSMCSVNGQDSRTFLKNDKL